MILRASSFVSSLAAEHRPGNQTMGFSVSRTTDATERSIMAKLFALTLVMLLSTGSSFAQSQRNYGPAGPATGDTMGQPYSGSAYARSGDDLPYTGYVYHLYWGRPHYYYWHHRYRYR